MAQATDGTPPRRVVGGPGHADVSPALRHVLQLAALVRPALARRLDLSVTEVWALEHLLSEPMGPVELSRRLEVTSAASTVMVRRLETSGHVVREPHPDDRRRTILRPTPGAQAEVLAVVEPMIADLEQAAAPLDQEQRQLVAGYLARVAEVLERIVADAPGATEGEDRDRPGGAGDGRGEEPDRDRARTADPDTASG